MKRQGGRCKQFLDDLKKVEKLLEIERGTARSLSVENIFLEEALDLS
jgi:hypothetical protein